MLHLIDLISRGLSIDKLANRLFRCSHNILKLILFIDSQCKAGQGDEQVSGTAFEPRITGQYIMFFSLLIMKLVRRVLETMIETVTRGTVGNFSLESLFQFTRRDLGNPAEKTILSPFFISTSKYPGTYKSSLKSYPRSCSFGYSMPRYQSGA